MVSHLQSRYGRAQPSAAIHSPRFVSPAMHPARCAPYRSRLSVSHVTSCVPITSMRAYIDESESRLLPPSPGRIAFGLAAELILFWRVDIEDADDLTPNLNRIAIDHRGRAGNGFCAGCGTGLAAEQVSVSVMAIRSRRILPQKRATTRVPQWEPNVRAFPAALRSQLSLHGS